MAEALAQNSSVAFISSEYSLGINTQAPAVARPTAKSGGFVSLPYLSGAETFKP